MDAETMKRIWGQVEPLLREFKALTGVPRSQTHRAALGCMIAATMVPVLDDLRASAPKATPPTLPAPMPVPPSWRRAKIGADVKWNGRCRRCGRAGRGGQVVLYSPTGRPSMWQHWKCEVA